MAFPLRFTQKMGDGYDDPQGKKLKPGGDDSPDWRIANSVLSLMIENMLEELQRGA